MPVVFCKPDALYGPASMVDGQRAGALLAALAARCGKNGLAGVDGRWRPAAERAAVQISERARSEPTFRGALHGAQGAHARLTRAAAILGPGPVSTSAVLRTCVEGLGFAVQMARRIILREAGVTAVYGGATTTVEFEEVRTALFDYLATEPVDVWVLSGEQDACVLQWWKTYVRHMLLDRRPGEYLMRNLVHVCDGSDADYLQRRLAG
jgi:hypothetical protein